MCVCVCVCVCVEEHTTKYMYIPEHSIIYSIRTCVHNLSLLQSMTSLAKQNPPYSKCRTDSETQIFLLQRKVTFLWRYSTLVDSN